MKNEEEPFYCGINSLDGKQCMTMRESGGLRVEELKTTGKVMWSVCSRLLCIHEIPNKADADRSLQCITEAATFS